MSRLTALGNRKDTDREENADPRKDYARWWEGLERKYQDINLSDGQGADIHQSYNLAKGIRKLT